MWWLRNKALATIKDRLSKQFLALSGDRKNQTLFQEAVARLNQIHADSLLLGKTGIVTNEDHRFLVLDQLRELDDAQATLLLEPVGRNTAPALTIATLYAREATIDEDINPILVVTPANQTMQNGDAFAQALRNCITSVESDASNKTIAIMGITPTGPETGYGYIKRSDNKGSFSEYAVEKFAEKPNREMAVAYLKNGKYFWNSGMFVLRVSTWLNALKEFRPDIFDATQKAWQKKGRPGRWHTIYPTKKRITYKHSKRVYRLCCDRKLPWKLISSKND